MSSFWYFRLAASAPNSLISFLNITRRFIKLAPFSPFTTKVAHWFCKSPPSHSCILWYRLPDQRSSLLHLRFSMYLWRHRKRTIVVTMLGCACFKARSLLSSQSFRPNWFRTADWYWIQLKTMNEFEGNCWSIYTHSSKETTVWTFYIMFIPFIRTFNADSTSKLCEDIRSSFSMSLDAIFDDVCHISVLCHTRFNSELNA